MQDSLSTSAHSNSHSSRLRSPKDSTRRTSHLASLLSEERKSYTPSTSGHSDRDRHWNTILGHPPHNADPQVIQSNSLPLLTRQTVPRRAPIAPSRSPPSRDSRPTATQSSSKTRQQNQATLEAHPLPPRQLHDSSQKPFACGQCSRRFERKGHLKSHVDAVHEQQQPYECHVIGCHRKFSHQSSLNRHLKGVHHQFAVQESNNETYIRR